MRRPEYWVVVWHPKKRLLPQLRLVCDGGKIRWFKSSATVEEMLQAGYILDGVSLPKESLPRRPR